MRSNFVIVLFPDIVGYDGGACKVSLNSIRYRSGENPNKVRTSAPKKVINLKIFEKSIFSIFSAKFKEKSQKKKQSILNKKLRRVDGFFLRSRIFSYVLKILIFIRAEAQAVKDIDCSHLNILEA